MSARIAVVTGGTGTIGTEICKHLAQGGYRVVALCLPGMPDCQLEGWEAARAAEGYTMHARGCNVADFEDTAAAIKAIEAEIGPVSALVNAAGITRDAALRKMSPQQWREVLSANLDSVFNTTRCVIEGMLDRGFGRIVNISSVNGQKGQFGQANYAASKAGMHGLTMSVAREGARKGVTCNTVSPGYIESPMIMAVPEEHRAKIMAEIPWAASANPARSAAWWPSSPPRNPASSPAPTSPSTAASTWAEPPP
jgi:acetoacetyl-CoA reductase